MHPTPLSLAMIALLVSACGEPDASTPFRPDAGRDSGTSEAPLRHARRLTADQLHASLRVTTGQEWASFDTYAASLGQADDLRILEEGEAISVPFVRFAEDGARATCGAAVAAERAMPPGPGRAILGDVALDAPDDAVRARNLERLVLRFHGQVVSDPADPRLAAWQPVLDAPGDAGMSAADAEADRWEAICIGLATHSDFLTY